MTSPFQAGTDAPLASSIRLKPVPRLPRQLRQTLMQPSHLTLAAAALRLRTHQLLLRAVENGVSQDALLLGQITAQAGAFDTAAAWLASQGNPAAVQASHPLVAA